MRRIFSYQSQFRQNIISLHTNNTLNKYAFLETDISYLAANLNKSPINDWKSIRSVINFLSKRSVMSSLKTASEKDYKQSQLIDLSKQIVSNQQKNQLKNQDLNNLLKKAEEKLAIAEINKMAQFYEEIKNQFVDRICLQNMDNLIGPISDLNLIHVELWQKIFRIIQQNYKHSTFPVRQNWVSYIIAYNKKFPYDTSNQLQWSFIKILNNKYKFIFKNKCFNDIADLNHFLKSLECPLDFKFSLIQSKVYNQKPQKESFETSQDKDQLINIRNRKRIHLSKLMGLMSKLTKISNIDIYRFRLNYDQNTIDNLLNSFDYPLVKKDLYTFLTYYSFLNLINRRIPYGKIQQNLLQHFKNNSYSNPDKFFGKSLNKILVVWRNQARFNQQIYDLIVFPCIRYYLKTKTNTLFYSMFAFNLTCASLGENTQKKQKIYRLVSQLIKKKYADDKVISIVKHYLNIYYGKMIYHTNFNCRALQNLPVLQIINKPGKVIYSRNLQLQIVPQIFSFSNVAKPQSKDSHEYNSVEIFWQKGLDTILPPNNIIHNCKFDSFIVDSMFVGKSLLISIQIQGSHYNDNLIKFNNVKDLLDDFPQMTGKKMLKETIISYYDVKIIKIKCWAKEEQAIMKKNDLREAGKYLKEKIQEITQMPLAQLI